MNYVVRVEKWGEIYRLVKFKGSGISGSGKDSHVEYYGKKPWAARKPDVGGGLDEGTFWELKLDEEETKEAERLGNSVARSRTRIRELALCNDWEYFATFTLSPERNDRFDLAGFIKNLGVWIGNYNKKFHTHLKYLIIPEKHPTSGAWHAHGLLHGVSSDSLCTNEHGYLDLPYYRARFGFISLDLIRDGTKCSFYISKYVTKEMVETTHGIEKNKHLFYASRGLAGREFVAQGLGDVPLTFDNEFVGVRYVGADELADALSGVDFGTFDVET